MHPHCQPIVNPTDTQGFPPPPKSTQKRHILIIEDNKSDVCLLKTSLQRLFGRDTFDYADVPRLIDALELMDDALFDLAFLDLNLLDMEGCATVAALHAESPSLPIIVYSGSCDPELLHEVMLCGARHCVMKGHESDLMMRSIVRNHLAEPHA